jgi:hypothetical protein
MHETDRACNPVWQIAEGMHWLPVPTFLAEARRLLRPQAVFAAMGYYVCKFPDNPEAQKVRAHDKEVIAEVLCGASDMTP